MKQALITGGTGFVGANLVRRLLHEGHRVHLLVRPNYQTWRIEEVRPDVQFYETHLHDAENVSRLVSRIAPDWIFHAAAYGSYSWETDREQMVRTNIQGAMSLVTACVKVGFEAFVNLGSSVEYGFKDHAPAESEPIEPGSDYAVTKAAATLFCRQIAQRHHVHLPTLRLYSVYGPFEDARRLMPTLIMRGFKGELPPLVDPKVARDFIYVDDVVEACLHAARLPGKEWGAIYNVGTGAQTSICNVVKMVAELMNITAKPVWNTMPNRAWDSTIWVSDCRKVRTELAWQPQVNFEEGLRKMLAWFQQGPPPCYLSQPSPS
jgi:nucleoside-diphosphate-sugar epimerase